MNVAIKGRPNDRQPRRRGAEMSVLMQGRDRERAEGGTVQRMDDDSPVPSFIVSFCHQQPNASGWQQRWWW